MALQSIFQQGFCWHETGMRQPGWLGKGMQEKLCNVICEVMASRHHNWSGLRGIVLVTSNIHSVKFSEPSVASMCAYIIHTSHTIFSAEISQKIGASSD